MQLQEQEGPNQEEKKSSSLFSKAFQIFTPSTHSSDYRKSDSTWDRKLSEPKFLESGKSLSTETSLKRDSFEQREPAQKRYLYEYDPEIERKNFNSGELRTSSITSYRWNSTRPPLSQTRLSSSPVKRYFEELSQEKRSSLPPPDMSTTHTYFTPPRNQASHAPTQVQPSITKPKERPSSSSFLPSEYYSRLRNQ